MLSDRKTLIVPIERERLGLELPATLALGRVTLHRKTEHHLTVFGYSIGKHLKAACAAAPGLEATVNDLSARHAFAFEVQRAFVHLVQPALQTIVVRVTCDDVARFYAALRDALPEAARLPPLVDALGAPPPPHVTLYTTDEKGERGIGLNREADLDRALRGEGDLRAYALAPELIL